MKNSEKFFFWFFLKRNFIFISFWKPEDFKFSTYEYSIWRKFLPEADRQPRHAFSSHDHQKYVRIFSDHLRMKENEISKCLTNAENCAKNVISIKSRTRISMKCTKIAASKFHYQGNVLNAICTLLTLKKYLGASYRIFAPPLYNPSSVIRIQTIYMTKIHPQFSHLAVFNNYII